MAKLLGLDHVSIIVKDAEASIAFYRTLLNVELLERPDLGFPGFWINLFEGQSLHMMQLDNPNLGTDRPAHGGRDFHFALRVDELDGFIEKLDAMKRPYTKSRSGRKALFTKDLDGNVIELFECAG